MGTGFTLTLTFTCYTDSYSSAQSFPLNDQTSPLISAAWFRTILPKPPSILKFNTLVLACLEPGNRI